MRLTVCAPSRHTHVTRLALGGRSHNEIEGLDAPHPRQIGGGHISRGFHPPSVEKRGILPPLSTASVGLRNL